MKLCLSSAVTVTASAMAKVQAALFYPENQNAT